MYDYSRLLGKIKEKGFTQETLANRIGKSETTLNKKLNGVGRFSQTEMVGILDALGVPLDDVASYFFVR